MTTSHLESGAHSASRTHPMILVAAAAVTIASLAAVASLAGWLPGSASAPTPVAATVEAEPAKQATLENKQSTETAAPGTGKAARQNAEAPARAASVPRSTPQRTANPASTQTAEGTSARSMRGATPVSDSGIVVEDSRPAVSRCIDCGTVESVREIARAGEPTALGTIAGGVIGGLLGNQVGKGSGRKVATIAGAVGGGFAGREIEKNARSSQEYEITVRFEDGGSRVFTQSQPPAWRNGDRVRVENDRIVAR